MGIVNLIKIYWRYFWSKLWLKKRGYDLDTAGNVKEVSEHAHKREGIRYD